MKLTWKEWAVGVVGAALMWLFFATALGFPQ